MTTLTDQKPIVVYAEQYRCPRCEGAIAPEAAAGNLRPQSLGQPLKRLLKIYCDHCAAGFKAEFVISDGRLEPCGKAVEMNGRELDGFRARLANLRGDLTREKAAR